MKRNVWVLGGAGFVGSAVVRAFEACGDCVTVVDGFMPQTGASRNNLCRCSAALLDCSVEKLTEEQIGMLNRADIIVDAMAWTSHLAALRDPEYDMQLNLCSHLHLLQRLQDACPAHILYLGSRAQYGRSCDDPILEGSRMFPDDIQGTHKTAADHTFRVLSRLKKLHVTCLRFPNCFGPGQKTEGNDIGLIGSFIREALRNQRIDVFGGDRCRCVVYVDDVARRILALSEHRPAGYDDFNIPGERVRLVDLVAAIIDLAQRGSYQITPLPEHIRAIDMSDTPVNGSKLERLIGRMEDVPFSDALSQTIAYFRRETHDLAL